ncbi:ABC transporter permease [Altererythrobacter aurantiacus]|uniref:Transport permease protein n=1 Tax=Parapontixanthobacter aurantiacus TaxID=1463599 RepID=A0A844ZDB6_9SPHN|nr:ABC transporter permease [Parapontixanthobacter aurantiacus]MXO85865.1 ABC transporter permease [Parapontixanthobacter aurantiacus]
MADQAEPTEIPQSLPVTSAFSPYGEPVITGVNTLGLWSLYLKEVRRFLKVQTQTIWGPAVSTLLFLVIFDVALGRAGREVLGVPFASFIAPGLIVMAMMQNAFANTSFSLLAGKIQGTIIDLLMPPLSVGELMAGIVAAGITRAFMVGAAMVVAVILYPNVSLGVEHIWAIAWFGLMGATMLSLFGLLTSIWAEKFDHNAAITTLVVAPLALLSGTFYTIDNLHGIFQTISRANPFFYVISGFRYGFIGESDIGSGTSAVVQAAIGLGVFNLALAVIVYLVLKSGWKIKS